MDKEQLEQFSEQPEVVLDAGEYVLRIEEVEIRRSAIRPLCIVVGGDSDGRRACPETYDFTEGGENRAAILNLYGWGITEEELTETGGDVTSIGALLVGRVARIELQQGAGETGGVVNTHAPGAIEPLAQ